MKRFLKRFFITTLSLYLIVLFIPGVSLNDGLKPLLISALALTFLNKLAKPLLKLLFLPFNLVTLGLFRWLINVITLYLLTIIVPSLTIQAFTFNGFSWSSLTIPSFDLGTFYAYVLVSFVLGLTTSFLRWLIK